MNCDATEQAIFDSIDGALTPESRAALEAHIRGCARCRETTRQAQRLDASLSKTLAPVPWPSDFQSRLQARIRAESAPESAVERAERIRQAEEEYATGLARLKYGWRDSGALVEWFVSSALIGVGGWLGWRLVGHLLIQPASLDSASIFMQLLTLALAGALFLAASLLSAQPSARRRLAVWLTLS
jgi:anti-sigma factor RsiW